MWSSSTAHFCTENPTKCSGGFNSYLSGYNKHSDLDANLIKTVDYLNIVVTISSIVFFYFGRKYQFKVNDLLEQSKTTQE